MIGHLGSGTLRDRLVSLGSFAALALLLRLQFLGTPLQHIDEQFYLLVADRMAQGALPYVDLWDRKPLGLFLIYRLAIALPGNPVLWVQLFGLGAAIATAAVVERLARLIAPPIGARLAGLAYLAFMPVFGCGYAQSPVFFNLPVALAALVTIRASLRADSTGLASSGLARSGLFAMALVGTALQVKYTAVTEGAALGLMLLWSGMRAGIRAFPLALMGLGWIAMALLPTALVLGGFVLAGHGPDFVQANFLSVFSKTMGDGRELVRLGQAALILSPFAVAAFLGPRAENGDAHLRLRWWGASAVLGYAVLGHWYDHYVGPMIAPLCVLAAPMLGQIRWFRLVLFGTALAANAVVGIDRHLNDGTAAQLDLAVSRIRAELHGGCLYQYQGQAVLYRLTGACIPTRFPFPDHLATAPEGPALGVEPVAEEARIMASRPAVVLVEDAAQPYMQNAATRAVVDAALVAGYVKKGQIVVGRFHWGFWVLRR